MSQLQPQPKYKIYPSLLDSFLYYRGSEKETAEQELIDKINRVPFHSDAADKGTAFNNVVDRYLLEGSVFPEIINGQTFSFDTELVEKVASYLQGAMPQVFIETIVKTKYGYVQLYGYADYVLMDKVIDLKTTENYDIGKYSNSMQKHVYPLALTDTGNEINSFEFLVTNFNAVFTEPYKFNYAESVAHVTSACEILIEFLEAKRDLITDKKIFSK